MSSNEEEDSQLPDPFGDIAVERRRSHRESVVAIGKITALEPSEERRGMQVLITDLSLHGCDFRCITRPCDGMLYRIEVSIGPVSLTSRMRVIRTHVRSDSTYAIGAEFV